MTRPTTLYTFEVRHRYCTSSPLPATLTIASTVRSLWLHLTLLLTNFTLLSEVDRVRLWLRFLIKNIWRKKKLIKYGKMLIWHPCFAFPFPLSEVSVSKIKLEKERKRFSAIICCHNETHTKIRRKTRPRRAKQLLIHDCIHTHTVRQSSSTLCNTRVLLFFCSYLIILKMFL